MLAVLALGRWGPLASCTCSGDSASFAIIAQALIVILCTIFGNFPSLDFDFALLWGDHNIECEASRVASAGLHDKGGLDPAPGRGGLVAVGSRGREEIFRNIPSNQWAIGHTSHLTSLTHHITPHTSHITLHITHLITHHITHHTSQITHYTSHITHHTSDHTSHLARDIGHSDTGPALAQNGGHGPQ